MDMRDIMNRLLLEADIVDFDQYRKNGAAPENPAPESPSTGSLRGALSGRRSTGAGQPDANPPQGSGAGQERFIGDMTQDELWQYVVFHSPNNWRQSLDMPAAGEYEIDRIHVRQLTEYVRQQMNQYLKLYSENQDSEHGFVHASPQKSSQNGCDSIEFRGKCYLGPPTRTGIWNQTIDVTLQVGLRGGLGQSRFSAQVYASPGHITIVDVTVGWPSGMPLSRHIDSLLSTARNSPVRVADYESRGWKDEGERRRELDARLKRVGADKILRMMWRK